MVSRLIAIVLGLGLAAPALAEAPAPSEALKAAADRPAPSDAQTALQLSGKMTQGGLIRGRTVPGAALTLDGEPVQVGPQGEFVFGFGRDYEGPARVEITLPSGAVQVHSLDVAKREYKIQRIDGLPPKKVTPDEEALKRIRREAALKRAARPADTPETSYAEDFIWPVTGIITGTYGSQRILNGEPRRPHYGIDIAAPSGTPIKAPASGVVTLAEPDMYFEGGLIFIDHGHGVIGVLMHVKDIVVKPGQRVAQGETVAHVGSTGRSTGAHLDWRMYWRAARVDPSTLVGPMPKPEKN